VKKRYTILVIFVCALITTFCEAIAQDKPITTHIQSFDIQGNTVIPTRTLESILNKYMANHFPDAKLSLTDMKVLTDQITLLYKERGYFLARCYLPKQDIKAGVLKLMVAEGILDQIQVTGNTYYSENLLKRYFASSKDNFVIDERHLEKGLILINDLPSNHTELLLTKGEKTGSVDIVLKNEDHISSQLHVAYNNYGAENTSKNRYSLTGQITDPYGGMTLLLKGISGDDPSDIFVGYANLDIPVNYRGTSLSFSFLKSSSQLGQELEILAIEGQTEKYGFNVKHPLVLKRNMRINTFLGAHHLFSETTAWETVSIGTYELNTVAAGFDLDMIDHYFGKTRARCAYQLSFVDKGPGIEKTNKALQKLTISGSRVQKIQQNQFLTFKMNGQWSPDDLIPVDQLSIGGYDSVRGHALSSYLGDTGCHFTLEWMMSPKTDHHYLGQPLSKLLQFGLFVDHGLIRLNNDTGISPESKSLGGYGMGLRLFYKEYLSCFTDIGLPMSREDDADDVIVYFSLQALF